MVQGSGVGVWGLHQGEGGEQRQIASWPCHYILNPSNLSNTDCTSLGPEICNSRVDVWGDNLQDQEKLDCIITPTPYTLDSNRGWTVIQAHREERGGGALHVHSR